MKGQAPTPNQIGNQLHDSHVHNQMEAAKGTGKRRVSSTTRYCCECGNVIPWEQIENGVGKRCAKCWEQLRGLRMR